MTPRDSDYAKKLYMKESYYFLSTPYFSLCAHMCVFLGLIYFILSPEGCRCRALLGQKTEIILKAQDGRHKRLKHSALSVRGKVRPAKKDEKRHLK